MLDFSKRKLPLEATSQLRMCPVDTIEPYALMIAPVYVLLRRNQKYVSVKAPLDFFLPDELARLRSFETFFMPEFVDLVLPYRQLARRLKVILGWSPVDTTDAIPPAPFEIADAVLRIMAPLWGGGSGIEAFFVTVFSNEFCALLPGEELMAARDRDLPGFERAVVLSAWMIFLSLHIGISDRDYLDALRLRTFRKLLGERPDHPGIPRLDDHAEAGELFRVVLDLLPAENLYRKLTLEDFENRSERVAQKIATRIRRVNGALNPVHPLLGSIRGERGIVDV